MMIDIERQLRLRMWRWVERLLLIAGVVLLGWYFVESEITRQYQERQAATLGQALTTSRPTIPLNRGTRGRGDGGTTNPGGIDAGRPSAANSLTGRVLPGEPNLDPDHGPDIDGTQQAPPSTVAPDGDPGLIGRIDIARVGVSSIVRDGDDAATLGRAVGHVTDTARPGDMGNLVLAGHRDTFFRGLRDIRTGDIVRLTTPAGEYRYRVSRTSIVLPTDVSVLNATATKTLTLVTCFPFSYIGSAPKRFIVHADQIAEPAPRIEAPLVAATAASMPVLIPAADDQPGSAVASSAGFSRSPKPEARSQTVSSHTFKPDATTVGRPRSGDSAGLAAAAVRASTTRHRAANNKTRGVGGRKTAASAGSKTGWSKIFTPFRKLFGKGDRKAPAAKAPSKARAPK